jgi:hypothetical protein
MPGISGSSFSVIDALGLTRLLNLVGPSMKMKEEVKYVCQEGPLLDEKKGLPLTAVYQETTITNGKVLRPQVLGFTDKYCTPNVCSRLRLVITILALAACVAVIIVSWPVVIPFSLDLIS